MKRPPEKRSGAHVAADAASMKKPDTLRALSSYLSGRWARHRVLFDAFGAEADRHAMQQMAVFCEVVKEVQG
jgi:hypothetical protein